jgi:hypothetical protein
VGGVLLSARELESIVFTDWGQIKEDNGKVPGNWLGQGKFCDGLVVRGS